MRGQAEYIWLDGALPTQELRASCFNKTLSNFSR